MKKSLPLLVLLALIVAGYQYATADNSNGSTNNAPSQYAASSRAVAVVTAAVEQHELSQSVDIIGKLKAVRSVIIAPQITGRISGIDTHSNQHVKKGQLLIQLDDAKAQAAVREASAYLQDEKRKLAEYTRLVSRNAITQTEIEAQKANVDIADARLQSALADLEYHALKAPFSGNVGLVNFSNGKMVAIGTELISLDDLSQLQLDLNVPEQYLSQLTLGMAVRATSRAWPGQTFNGTLSAIDPRVDEESLTLKVRIDFANPKNQLKPGMMMAANVTFAPVSEPIIPVQAIEYSGTKRFVYLIDSDNKARRTQVNLGARIQDQVLIEDGLNIGDTVVVQGLVNMRDGLLVKPLSPAGTAQAQLTALKSPKLGDDAKQDITIDAKRAPASVTTTGAQQ